MSIHPYIHFQDGRCREAMAFYAEVLGGTDLMLSRYAELPESPEAWKGSDRIMHARMRVGDGMLMGADDAPGAAGEPQQSVSIMHAPRDAEAGRRIFDRLSEEGSIVVPYGPTSWSPGFGMLKDRFGTHWMLSTTPAAELPAAEPSSDSVEEAEAHPT